MPYPKDHKTKSKDLILSSAIELFSRHGFDKVSIGQIMNAANMTHGAFYSHFASKEELFDASFLRTLGNTRSARLVKHPLTVGHLSALVSNCWNLSELENGNKPGPETLLFNEIGNDNTKVKRLFEVSYDNLKQMIETRVVALSKLNRFPSGASRETITEKTRAILAAIVGAVVIAKSISQEEERQKILEAAQKQILNILGVNDNELVTKAVVNN